MSLHLVDNNVPGHTDLNEQDQQRIEWARKHYGVDVTDFVENPSDESFKQMIASTYNKGMLQKDMCVRDDIFDDVMEAVKKVLDKS